MGSEHPFIARHDPEITVGPANADLLGDDDTALQSALLLAKARGVPRVRIRKGVYVCRTSVLLQSGIALIGEGEDTVLKKAAFCQSPVLRSVHHYERVVAVGDPALFPPGAGIRLCGIDRQGKHPVSACATVIARDGHDLLVDRDCFGQNFWLECGETKVTNEVALLRGDGLSDIAVGALQLDGLHDGTGPRTYANDGLCLWNCRTARVHDLFCHHLDGDAIGFELSHHVTVEDCRVESSSMPLHAGSGSRHMQVRRNRLLRNDSGFYFCWGIQHGLLEDNEIAENNYGISVGFHDSHNLIRRNRVLRNRNVGITFRVSHHPSQSPVDVQVEENELLDNGPADAPLGIHIEQQAADLRLLRNRLTDTRRPARGAGIRIAPTVGPVHLDGNLITGFALPLDDQRPA